MNILYLDLKLLRNLDELREVLTNINETGNGFIKHVVGDFTTIDRTGENEVMLNYLKYRCGYLLNHVPPLNGQNVTEAEIIHNVTVNVMQGVVTGTRIYSKSPLFAILEPMCNSKGVHFFVGLEFKPEPIEEVDDEDQSIDEEERHSPIDISDDPISKLRPPHLDNTVKAKRILDNWTPSDTGFVDGPVKATL